MRFQKKIKLMDGLCLFCRERDYDLLDVHRILEGKNGGKYTRANTITSCSKCHRKIDSGRISKITKYVSTGGIVVCYTEDGVDKITLLGDK